MFEGSDTSTSTSATRGRTGAMISGARFCGAAMSR